MKFSLALLLVFSAVAMLQATSLPSKKQKQKAIEFYTTLKLKMGCYGRETVAKWFQDSEEMVAKCMTKLKEEHEEKTAVEPAVEFPAAPAGSNLIFSARRVDYLVKKTKKSIKMAQCYLDNFNMTIAANGQVDGSAMKDLISADIQNPDLRQYVLEGFEKCEKKTTYGDYTALGAEKENLLKQVKLFRCVRACKLKACVKYDLNQNKDMFDLSPLADAPQDVDEIHKMMLVVANYASADKSGLF